MSEFYIKQTNTSPVMQATLRDALGAPINLAGADVQFRMRAEHGSALVVDREASITNAANGVVQFAFTADDTASAGRYYAEFEVEYADGSTETFPNVFYIVVSIDAELP